MRHRKVLIPYICIFLLGTLSFAAPQGEPQAKKTNSGLAITIIGGLAFIPGGDMKEWFDSEARYYRWLGEQSNYNTQSDYPFSHSAFLPGLEVECKITPQIGLSLGAGYFKKSWEPSSTVTYSYGGDLSIDTLKQSFKREVTIVPVTITGMYIVPVHNKLDINLLAGLGYYITDFSFSDEATYSWPNAPEQQNYQYTHSTALKSSPGVLGFHFGAGLEIELFSHVSMSIDVLYRIARVAKIKGNVDWKESTSWNNYQKSGSGKLDDQTLWHGKYTWAGTSYVRAAIDEIQPSWLEGARAFEFSLNGLALRAGIKIELW